MATKKTQGTDWANAADLGSSDAWAKAKPLSFDYSNAAREEETPEVRAPVDDRGTGISDTGYGLAKGGVDLVKDLSGVVAWGANAVGIEDDPNKGILDESLKSASDYLQSKKSEEIRAKEAELGRLISDDNYSVGDVAAYVASNPSLAIQMSVEALPGMVAMVAGGAGAATKLKFVESAIKSGGFKRLAATTLVGGGMEGIQMAGSAYNDTQDSGAAAMALGLGVVTGLAPGNLVSAAIERGALKTGAKEGIEGLLLRESGVKGFLPATGRAARAVAGEASQEGIQSTGEALIHQYGKGEELNFTSATKEGEAFDQEIEFLSKFFHN